MILPALAIGALLSFAAAIVLWLFFPVAPAASLHLAFAAGVMPLIMGAISHFVPVLTRGARAGHAVQVIPLLMTVAGALIFLSLVLPSVSSMGYLLAAPLGFSAACAMAAWIYWRGRATLGNPHPCLNWYLAATGCLALALAAIAISGFWPEQRQQLKLFHAHMNTLGFVGLTAIGTLQVLLPTAAGRADGQAARRLRSDLGLAVAGVLLIAGGAAWIPLYAWLGAALLAFPLIRLAMRWATLYGSDTIFKRDGAAPALAAALAGFVIVLLFGAAHVAGITRPADTLYSFVVAFLLPLVTGAVSQLLPVWLRPGVQTAWHGKMRQALTRFGGVRALLFLAAGIGVGMGWRWSVLPALLALVVFFVQLLSTVKLPGGSTLGHR